MYIHPNVVPFELRLIVIGPKHMAYLGVRRHVNKACYTNFNSLYYISVLVNYLFYLYIKHSA